MPKLFYMANATKSFSLKRLDYLKSSFNKLVQNTFRGTVCLLLVSCLFMPSMAALADLQSAVDYPVYEVAIKGAYLRSDTKVRGDIIICGLHKGAHLIVLGEYNDWYLVYTKDEQIGFTQRDSVFPTGETCALDIDFSRITYEKPGQNVSRIAIDENTSLPAEAQTKLAYSPSISRSLDRDYQQTLLPLLLGTNYVQKEEDAVEIIYESTNETKVYRYVYLNKSNGRIRYYDTQAAREEESEYAIPNMDIQPKESMKIAQKEAARILGYERAKTPSERWLTEYRRDTVASGEEDDAFIEDVDSRTFVFERIADNGINILDGETYVTADLSGIIELDVDCSQYGITSEAPIHPLPLDDALVIASRTCLYPTTLLYAELVYSALVTGNDELNLCWYFVTGNGSYVVDCVLKVAVCI